VAEHARLQLDDDIDFQRRESRVQRVGWSCLAAFVAAALLGLFGSGPFSHAVATASGLSVEYERFVRADARSLLTIALPPSETTTATLSISRNYIDAVDITQMLPEPSTSELREAEAIFSFERRDADRTPVIVQIELKPRAMGRPTATLRSGVATVTFTQLTYP
jgi:hypothetical protein